MMIYRLRETEVALDSDDPNVDAEIQIEGENADEIREVLAMQRGAFGHFIGDATTPIDLHYAMLSDEMQEFEPVLVEGEDLVRTYETFISEDALT